MTFSQIIPPSPSPTESKRLFYTSVSLLLSRIQGYLEKEMATHSSYPCLENPMEKPVGLQSTGSQWGCKQSDMTERLQSITVYTGLSLPSF